MLELIKRSSGSYPLDAYITDADGLAATVTTPVVTVYDLDGTQLSTGEPNGDLIYALPFDAVTIGVFRMAITGMVDGHAQEWTAYFSIIDSLEASPTELLADIRTAVRITSTAFDAELEGLIAAAKADLVMSGVAVASVNAPRPAALIRTAIINYCKAHFGLDNPDSEKYLRVFASIETALALSTEHGATP